MFQWVADEERKVLALSVQALLGIPLKLLQCVYIQTTVLCEEKAVVENSPFVLKYASWPSLEQSHQGRTWE